MIKNLSKSKIKANQVVLRLDLNEPLQDSGKYVADDFRIQKSLPTIDFLQKQGKTIIILAHLGRPDGRPESKYSLLPVAKALAQKLEYQLITTQYDIPQTRHKHLLFFTGNLADPKVQKHLHTLPQGSVVLCENIRFYPGEEENSAVFGKHLAGLGGAYINDAFSVSHHAASSICSITKYLPSYAGLQLEKEIIGLDKVLHTYKKPMVVLMGGKKIADKVSVLLSLGKNADTILLGGVVANEVLESQGYNLYTGETDEETKRTCEHLWRNFKNKLQLPKDIVASKPDDIKTAHATGPQALKPDERALDIGPETILAFTKVLKNAGTIVWNGPMGWFEKKPFNTGTLALAKIVGSVGKRTAFVVVGGGETVDAVREAKQTEYIDLLSTGGGAMLAYLAGEKLPGIEALG